MSTVMLVELKTLDVYQIIDALNARACAYEKTARYLRGEQTEDEFIVAEDCKDSDEANEIAHHFRDIVVSIEGQINIRH